MVFEIHKHTLMQMCRKVLWGWGGGSFLQIKRHSASEGHAFVELMIDLSLGVAGTAGVMASTLLKSNLTDMSVGSITRV